MDENKNQPVDKKECPICKGSGKVFMKNNPTSDITFPKGVHEEICGFTPSRCVSFTPK